MTKHITPTSPSLPHHIHIANNRFVVFFLSRYVTHHPPLVCVHQPNIASRIQTNQPITHDTHSVLCTCIDDPHTYSHSPLVNTHGCMSQISIHHSTSWTIHSTATDHAPLHRHLQHCGFQSIVVLASCLPVSCLLCCRVSPTRRGGVLSPLWLRRSDDPTRLTAESLSG